jgi:hypothetical protein
VHRRLLRGRRAAIDPGVTRDQIGLGVRVGPLVLGDQPPRAGIRPVVQQQPVDVLVPRVLVPGDVLEALIVDLEGGVRLLLGEQLIEGLALLLLLGRRAEPYSGRPPFRRSHPTVERVISRVPLERVGRVLHLVIG